MSISTDNRISNHGLETGPHRFSVGQLVRLIGRIGVWPKTDEVYRVTATLPPRDNLLQYRIRSDNERHERVATEDNLEPVRTPPIAGGAVFAPRTARAATETPAPKGEKASDRESPAPKPGKTAAKPAVASRGKARK